MKKQTGNNIPMILLSLLFVLDVFLVSGYFYPDVEGNFWVKMLAFPNRYEVQEEYGELVDENMEEVLPSESEETPETTGDIIGIIEAEAEEEQKDNDQEKVITIEDVQALAGSMEISYANSLFIGDSRMVGIKKFSGLEEGTFYADTGMSIYNVYRGEKVEGYPRKIKLEDLLADADFDRIYVMMGINELGYHFDVTKSHYDEFINFLREREPDAEIYLQANLHVTAKSSARDSVHNNEGLDRMNEMLAEYVDGEHIFYMDINPMFDDENGALDSEYTGDGVHVKGKYHAAWLEWITEETAFIEAWLALNGAKE